MNKLAYIALGLFIVITLILLLLPKKWFANTLKKDFGVSEKEWKIFHKVAYVRPLIGFSAIITIIIMLIVKAIV